MSGQYLTALGAALGQLSVNCRTNIPRYQNYDGWTYAWANWAGWSVEWIEVMW